MKYDKRIHKREKHREIIGWMSPITTDAPCCEAAVYAQGAADK